MFCYLSYGLIPISGFKGFNIIVILCELFVYSPIHHSSPPHRREGCFVLAIWCQMFHLRYFMRGRTVWGMMVFLFIVYNNYSASASLILAKSSARFVSLVPWTAWRTMPCLSTTTVKGNPSVPIHDIMSLASTKCVHVK